MTWADHHFDDHVLLGIDGAKIGNVCPGAEAVLELHGIAIVVDDAVIGAVLWAKAIAAKNRAPSGPLKIPLCLRFDGLLTRRFISRDVMFDDAIDIGGAAHPRSQLV